MVTSISPRDRSMASAPSASSSHNLSHNPGAVERDSVDRPDTLADESGLGGLRRWPGRFVTLRKALYGGSIPLAASMKVLLVSRRLDQPSGFVIENHLVMRYHVAVLFVCALLGPVPGWCRVALAWTTNPVGRVAMLNLTKSDRYDSIAVINGRIILGPAPPSLEYPSTSSTCSSGVVNPSTLALSDVRHGSCADPALFGRSVIPAISIDKDLPAKGGGPSAVVRIAHVTARSPGYALGPIVMTFPALAYGQTDPSWIYGDGDLWLYDWENRFDLLRVSATTGAVLQRLSVPKIQTPLLAFNDDGLWIAPYGESSGPLYRLAPGATKVSAVLDLGSDGFA